MIIKLASHKSIVSFIDMDGKKIMPKGKHSKKAGPEAIEASKKLNESKRKKLRVSTIPQSA